MNDDQGAGNGLSRTSIRVKRETNSTAASEEHDGNAAKTTFASDRGDGIEGVNTGRGTERGEIYAAAAAAAAPGSKGEKRSNVAGFLAKAYQIFDNPAWSDVCGWGNNGETVVIRKQVEFAKHILPLFFNHSNLQSFVRQLNMYNFRKVVQDPNSGEFRHDLFRQGNEHLLHLIKRKQSPTAPASSSVARTKQELENGDGRRQYAGGTEGSHASDTAKMAGGIMKEADSVLEELVRLRQWQKEMENTVVELKRANQTLQSENQMLKGQVTEHASQQLVLQNKMQKILYCMYDVYITGLKGANENQSAAIREITELADSKGDSDSGHSNGDSEDGRPVKNLAEGAAAGSALEGAIAQLAALGGESMSGRLNLLDMENPWANGLGSDSGSGGGGDARCRPPSSGSSSANGILGGGALRRSRTWSQSSYEWLRSLRDPDPLQSVASQPTSPVASPAAAAVAAAAATAAVAAATSAVTTSSADKTSAAGTTSAADATTSSPTATSAAAAPTSEAGGAVAPADGDGGSSARTSCAKPWASSAATATPERSSRPYKRQRRSADSFASSSDSVDVDVDVNGSVNNGGLSGGGGGEVNRAPSFQPNAPILGDGEVGCGGQNNGVELGSPRDEGGNTSGEGQVWGGGALSRTLSEGANQVVSELGELGHCEGEALSKIDSLGYQLANLLDASEPIMGLDDVSVFGEGSGPLGLAGGGSVSPSVSLSGGPAGDGRAVNGAGAASDEDSGSPKGGEGANATAMATVNAPSSADDGLVQLAHSEGPAPAAARVRDAGATDGVDVGDGNVATLAGYPATVPDVVADLGVGALDNGGSNSNGISNGISNGVEGGEDILVEAGTEAAGASASGTNANTNAVAIAEEDGGSRDKTSTVMQAPLEIAGVNGAPLPVVSGEMG